jgi:hypothetical protein
MTCPQGILQYPEGLDIYFFLAQAKGANLLKTSSSLLPTNFED